MAIEPEIFTPPAMATDVITWIDKSLKGDTQIYKIVEKLTSLTLPELPWTSEGAVNPYRGELDAQFWFWNRAASNFIEQSRYDEAGEVWSAQYLTMLSLQLKYRQRYHKGMPLCNIGYAFARAGRRRLAVKSWLLGVIEDTITEEATASDALNFQNLLKLQVAPAILDQLILTVKSRMSSQSIVPQFPEMVIELWLNPTAVTSSEGCMKSVDIISSLLSSSYPKQPDPAKPWEGVLAPFWGFSDWAEGIYRGE